MTHVPELELIRRVTDRLVASLDFRDALRTLIEGATELLRVERGSILLLDPATRDLHIEVAIGIDPQVVATTRIAFGHGVAGTVAATGQPIVTGDIRRVAAWSPSARQREDYADLSALCVPLTLHGQVLGVMNFNHKRDRSPFGEVDLEFALLIANQAAVVLWSANLHREFLAKQVLDHELSIARSIQQRLLPQEVPTLAGCRLFARQLMCLAVGGDYYDFVPVDSQQVAIAIGDAAGHGVGSALVAAEVRATARECLARGDGLSETLARVSDRLHSDTAAGMYMTLLLGMLDPETRCFEFITTGHHMPVLLRDGKASQLQAVGANLPLGIRRGQAFTPEWPLGLRAGDALLLYTDGIWEAADARGRRFGDEGIARSLESSQNRDGGEMVDALFAAVAGHVDGATLEDDCTVVLLRVD